MDEDELASLTAEERNEMAEQLGIPIEDLTLKPKEKDRNLITPAHRITHPQILIEPCDSGVSAPDSTRRTEVFEMFEANLALVDGKNNLAVKGTGMTPRRQTFQQFAIRSRGASRRLSALVKQDGEFGAIEYE